MKCLEIYYLDINKILHLIDKDSLYSFVEKKDFKSEERKIQHALGRFLTKIIALKHNIETPQIYIKNNKPYFENNTLFFSITHTKNIVAVAIWKDNIGIDIEFMKDRDFAKYFERYSITPNGNDKNSFYEFWTKYEAEIKLQEDIKSFYTFEIIKDFMCTICTADKFDIKNNLKIQELSLIKNSNNELTNLKTLITNKNLSSIKLISR